jgi:hypothetical protein
LMMEFWILMQLMAAELVTAPAVTPASVVLHAATAGRGLLASASAATPIKIVVTNRWRARAIFTPARCVIPNTPEETTSCEIF